MGWGTFYKIKLTIDKNIIDYEDDDNAMLESLWNRLISAVAMTPVENKEEPFDWVDKCTKFVNENRMLIERIYNDRMLKQDYEDAKEYHPELIEKIDTAYVIDFNGYCSHIEKDLVLDELDTNKDIVNNCWRDILVEVTATPVQKRDDEDNEMEWHEWCTFFINSHRRDIEEYYEIIHHLEQCKLAMKDNPDSVVTG